MRFLSFALMFSFVATALPARAQSVSNPIQFSVAPTVSYTTYRGFAPGAKIGFGFLVAENVQLVADISSQWHQNLGNAVNVEVGGIYNQSSDVRYGAFFGLGGGWANTLPVFEFSDSAYLFGRAGYRWLLSESIGVSYAPYVGGRIGREARTELELQPLNFMFTF